MSEYEPLVRVTRSQMTRRWITRQIKDRRESRERIAELEAQVARLQDTIMALGTWITPSWDEDMDRTEATIIIQKHYTNDTLKWGDLDPLDGDA